MHLSAAGATAPGPRPANQDAHFVDLRLGVLVVADGMGGHNAGEVASRLAIETVVGFVRATHGGRQITWPFPFDPARPMSLNRMEAALRLANRCVRDAGQRDACQAGMGTTIVTALIEDERLVIGHVGDSRAYVVRDGALRQITIDHTWLNAVMGPDAAAGAHHPMRHVLTSGIGMAIDVSPSIAEERLYAGDRWLICTDGVHGYLDTDTLRRALDTSSPQLAAEQVIQYALEAGTSDNVTAVVLNVD